jgi:hypothetical protein
MHGRVSATHTPAASCAVGVIYETCDVLRLYCRNRLQRPAFELAGALFPIGSQKDFLKAQGAILALSEDA